MLLSSQINDFSHNNNDWFTIYQYKFQRGTPTYLLSSPSLQSRTGPEQGFPCEVFLTWKNLLSLQETPFLIAGTLFSLQGFPCEKNFTGKTLFSLQGMGLQWGFTD